MGNVPLAPGIDARIARTIVRFHLPMKKIQVLWRLFNKHDKLRTGYITADDFFDKIIHYKQTCMTDRMFQVIQSESDLLLSFGEFVELIATFACFEKDDLVNYFFYAMDLNKNGRIGKSELKSFVHGMWSHDSSQDPAHFLAFLENMASGQGNFNFKQVYHMQQHNPVVLYPLFTLQTQIRKHTLGERWSSHITHNPQNEEHTPVVLRHSEKGSAKGSVGVMLGLEMVTEEMIRQRMGDTRYYLLPWRREAEKAHILRMVAVDCTPRSTGRKSDPKSITGTKNQTPFA